MVGQKISQFVSLLIVITISLFSQNGNAQTLIPDEISLEQAVYANLQKGISEFHGITEKHTFFLEGKLNSTNAVASLKKDERVIAAQHDARRNALIVTIKKTSLDAARPWIEKLFVTQEIKVVSHELSFYKKD